MEHFVIIVNGWKPLTIITKRSILDVAAALDPPLLIYEQWTFFRWKSAIFFAITKYLILEKLRKKNWIILLCKTPLKLISKVLESDEIGFH